MPLGPDALADHMVPVIHEELTWVSEQPRRDIALEVQTALCRPVFEVPHNA